MAYTSPDFSSKKALKDAVNTGTRVSVIGAAHFPATQNGIDFVEGPRGKLHTWYAKVMVDKGVITKVY